MDFASYLASIKVGSGTDTGQKLRHLLDLLVLRNLGWSSKASETAVEAENVLMEKVSGRPQAEPWEDMQADDQLAVVEQIVQSQ